jgi:hypothetical protein
MPGMIERSEAPAEIEAAEPQAEDRPRILELAEVQATRIERDGAAYLRFSLIDNGQTITDGRAYLPGAGTGTALMPLPIEPSSCISVTLLKPALPIISIRPTTRP